MTVLVGVGFLVVIVLLLIVYNKFDSVRFELGSRILNLRVTVESQADEISKQREIIRRLNSTTNALTRENTQGVTEAVLADARTRVENFLNQTARRLELTANSGELQERLVARVVDILSNKDDPYHQPMLDRFIESMSISFTDLPEEVKELVATEGLNIMKRNVRPMLTNIVTTNTEFRAYLEQNLLNLIDDEIHRDGSPLRTAFLHTLVRYINREELIMQIVEYTDQDDAVYDKLTQRVPQMVEEILADPNDPLYKTLKKAMVKSIGQNLRVAS